MLGWGGLPSYAKEEKTQENIQAPRPAPQTQVSAAGIEQKQLKLKKRALSVLREGLKKGEKCVQVRAAEALLWHGYQKEVEESFGTEKAVSEPMYRIIVSRVLVKIAKNDQKRRQEAIFLTIAEEYFQTPCESMQTQVFAKQARVGSQAPWHQDNAYQVVAQCKMNHNSNRLSPWWS